MTDLDPQRDTGFAPHARFAPKEKLQVSLVSTDSRWRPRNWSGVAAEFLDQLADPSRKPGKFRIIGSAGTGVSSLVVDAVLARLRAGVDPASIVVLAASKESGSLLRREITAALPSLGYVSDGPMVRSVHSFAFALVRLAELQDSAPRLITGAEHDLVVRELLHIHSEIGAPIWPDNVKAALPMVGFARQLRDFILRAQERGLGSTDLIKLGTEHGRPMWVAAGEFLAEYQELQALSGAQLYNASELVTSALKILGTDTDFLVSQQRRINTIVVDDAQHLDPQAARLVELFADSAECAVVAGNPHQSVFHFRGATPASLLNFAATTTLELRERLRANPQIDVVCCDTPAVEMLQVADVLRRKNLLEGIPWKDMAVIVRSSAAVAHVRRSMLSAGVPVRIQPTDVVLSQQRLVANILLACRAITEPLASYEFEDLILGPVGGADTVTLRRLLRGLRRAELQRGGSRRAMEAFRELACAEQAPTESDLEFLTERERDILTRIRTVLRAGIDSYRAGNSVELILWDIWHATGLSDRLMNASLRGGALGSSADLDLDAMMTLFDAAGDFVERQPTANIARFVDHIIQQELPSGARDRRGVTRDAVSILTAHATAGQEWKVVAVAGVQEGQWPSLGITGSLFGQEELVDLIDHGIDPNIIIARTGERVAEERRLFNLAVSRASQYLHVSAVFDAESDEVDEPSRFLKDFAQEQHCQIRIVGQDEMAQDSALSAESLGYAPQQEEYPRLLSAPSIIAELRRVVENPNAVSKQKELAAFELGRLSDAGIYGAHPDQWWGLQSPSTMSPVVSAEASGRVSPSKIEAGLACPLRAVLAGVAEKDETQIHLVKGTLVHAAAEARAHKVPRATIEKLVGEAFAAVSDVPKWRQESYLAEWDELIARTLNYVEAHDAVGVEVPVRVQVGARADGTPIVIAGRMDRLEKNADGEYVIVDLKTGSSAATVKETQDHPQLLAYQLALHHGTLHEGHVNTAHPNEETLAVGSAHLVYPGVKTTKLTIRQQAPKTAEQLEEFAAKLPPLLDALAGPILEARVNESCDSCPLLTMCPAHQEGRPLTDVQ
ncbi:ATP-dependent DNA helicase [Corynebacterium epidermidicanis]|nr:ATP-dependent DNA helicase [Corynebacterium epidermidicanis]